MQACVRPQFVALVRRTTHECLAVERITIRAMDCLGTSTEVPRIKWHRACEDPSGTTSFPDGSTDQVDSAGSPELYYLMLRVVRYGQCQTRK